MTQRRGWRVTGGLVAVAIAGLLLILLVVGQVVASGRAAGESSGGTPALRSMVRDMAYGHWDNAAQRVVFRAYAVRRTGPATGRCAAVTDGDQSTWEVTAYTLFGIPLDRVTVTCDSIGRADP
jgi:hypothetical protein